ncbi:iron complex transport system substrate-binding protein [Streptoalloteichus tenebrarius]|uniref:Iron complex transport system substrate-binding protein n=1 Tax=Streptoalloteichus tenebrarius (strain ATCC 17920 / DSM 40477 / JCM 4838 / CBS 697.72 / NBRC 16177 / NCIMB 11028 / NRRL B-12390 / A12253. 1 / ISP 5477) TaxID=1933 RepID=A0ABT1HZI4_STRSD|nr:iron-siderophore ABC transporter substrate-binding protein [Streptoalloteichus tenebrarius]MCP2260921.1 iron complex transport system substrate-binding protein [Streptoalloteichus tenebrarius]
MRRRRIRPLTTLIALAAAAGLALSGCGDGGSAPAGGESSGQGAERVVKHAMGETKVPANPRRVVVLDTGELDSVLALGITPVGAVTTEVSSDFPAYLKDRLRDTKRVGTIPEPNLDKITEARPDLILSNKVRHAQLYDKLSQIAPTVFADQIGATWKETFLLDAEALGKKDEAEKLLGQYRDRARQVGQQLGDPATKKVSAVRFVTGSQTIRAYTPNSFLGTVLADTGVSRPQSQQGQKVFQDVSRENIGQLDGDVLLYASFGDPEKSGEKTVTEMPQWKSLGAVQAGKAHRVDDDHFYVGLGLLAANKILDDLKNILK